MQYKNSQNAHSFALAPLAFHIKCSLRAIVRNYDDLLETVCPFCLKVAFTNWESTEMNA